MCERIHVALCSMSNGSCDGSHCAPRYDGPWYSIFAFIPRKSNSGWKWLCWLHARDILLGGHSEIRLIVEYRTSL